MAANNSNNGNGILTKKQTRFWQAYLFETDPPLNGTEAARMAGYKGSENALAVVASRNLRNVKIRAAMADAMAQALMPQDEALVRLTKMAMGLIPTRVVESPNGRWTYYDAKGALELISRYYGLFKDRVEINWRAEVEAQGMSAGDIFEQMVAVFHTELKRQSDESDD